MKKIGIFLSSHPEQGGTFQYNVAMLDAVASLPRDQFGVTIVYTNALWQRYLPTSGCEDIFVALNMFGRACALMWREYSLSPHLWHKIAPIMLPASKVLQSKNCDLWVFPSQDCWSYQMEVPALVSILDLMHRYESGFPEVSAKGRCRRLDRHYAEICKWSKGVLADSEVGRRQVAESYGMPLERIFKLPYVPPSYLTDNKTTIGFASRYNLPEKYVFYPAQFWEHKNHARLIRAAALVRQKFPDFHLVLLGARKNAYKTIRRLVTELNLDESIHFMGYVPDEDMPEFYRRARAMVMPTFFGPTNIPPLEAMALGCPMAVSNVYAMPEQVGEAGLLFDPHSVEEIAAAIIRLWTDDDLCPELSRRGIEKSKLWSQTQFNHRLHEIIVNLLHMDS